MKRFDLESKYCEKIQGLNNMFENDNTYDNEDYHVELDETLKDLLKELRFEKVVELYEKAQKHFWYR